MCIHGQGINILYTHIGIGTHTNKMLDLNNDYTTWYWHFRECAEPKSWTDVPQCTTLIREWCDYWDDRYYKTIESLDG